MERTELVEKFDTETGCSLERARKTGKVALLKAEYIKWLEAQIPTGEKIAVSAEYLRVLEAKAAAYDRLMSGGKKTLKEWANIFGMVVAVDMDGEAWAFSGVPVIDREIWRNNEAHYGQGAFEIPKKLVEFDGNWKDSLTLPDGWEEK